jgi:hypothetical protein
MYEEAGEINGVPFLITKTMRADIENTGFENVVERVLKAPLGGWPADQNLREIGMWCLLSFDTGLEGWAMATLTRVMGVSDTRASVALTCEIALTNYHISGLQMKYMFCCKFIPTSVWYSEF